jgi:hypothetical protein
MAHHDSPLDVGGSAGSEVDKKDNILTLVKGLFRRCSTRDEEDQTGEKQYRCSSDSLHDRSPFFATD